MIGKYGKRGKSTIDCLMTVGGDCKFIKFNKYFNFKCTTFWVGWARNEIQLQIKTCMTCFINDTRSINTHTHTWKGHEIAQTHTHTWKGSKLCATCCAVSCWITCGCLIPMQSQYSNPSAANPTQIFVQECLSMLSVLVSFRPKELNIKSLW